MCTNPFFLLALNTHLKSFKKKSPSAGKIQLFPGKSCGLRAVGCHDEVGDAAPEPCGVACGALRQPLLRSMALLRGWVRRPKKMDRAGNMFAIYCNSIDIDCPLISISLSFDCHLIVCFFGASRPWNQTSFEMSTCSKDQTVMDTIIQERFIFCVFASGNAQNSPSHHVALLGYLKSAVFCLAVLHLQVLLKKILKTPIWPMRLMDEENINPIEKLEASSLLLASIVHGAPKQMLLQPAALAAWNRFGGLGHAVPQKTVGWAVSKIVAHLLHFGFLHICALKLWGSLEAILKPPATVCRPIVALEPHSSSGSFMPSEHVYSSASRWVSKKPWRFERCDASFRCERLTTAAVPFWGLADPMSKWRPADVDSLSTKLTLTNQPGTWRPAGLKTGWFKLLLLLSRCCCDNYRSLLSPEISLGATGIFGHAVMRIEILVAPKPQPDETKQTGRGSCF